MGVLKLQNLLGIAAASLAVPLCIAPRIAWAQDAVSYSNSQRTMKVGILLVDSTADLDGNGTITPAVGVGNPGFPTEGDIGAENVDPYVFQIADLRKDIKPLGWDFVNPIAPKTVTTDVYSRWLARDPANPYGIGDPVQKNMGAYWEVSLSKTPLADLVQFDALMLSTHTRLKFSLSDREKLRKLVDAGGMLWLDDCGGMRVNPAGPLFLDGVQFQGSFGTATAGLPFVFQPEHPILNSPNRLNIQQISLLGEYSDYRDRSLATLNPTGGPSIQQSPNAGVLTNVVGNQARGGLPYIAVGQYGSGTIVTTAGDTGCAINDYVGGTRNSVGSGGNSGAYMNNPKLERAHSEDLLFLYNLVQLGGSNSTFRRNNRRVGASTENLRSPLTAVFDFTQAGTPPSAVVNSVSAPLVVRDRVYVSGLDSAGAITVRCYNAKPSFKRGDEGVPDLSLGAPYDEIWRATYANPFAGRQPSTPILATVFAGGGTYLDVIYVTLPDGSVLAMPALPRDGSGHSLPVNIPSISPVDLVGANDQYVGIPGPAPAPVFYENRVYVVQPDGIVRCLDANTLGTYWKSVDAPPTDDITPTGSPTLGVVQLTESTSSRTSRSTNLAARSNGSTSDVMLYVPVLDTRNRDKGKILSFWLASRHEVIEQPVAPGNYPTRIYAGGSNTHWIANTVVNPLPAFTRAVARVYASQTDMENGVPHPTYTGAVTDAGLAEVRDVANNPPPPGLPLVVSVDYDLLYVPGTAAPALGPAPGAGAGGTGARNTGPALDIPGNTQDGSYGGANWGLDTPVLSADDTLFFTALQQAGPNTGGSPPTDRTNVSLLGVREQFGTGTTKMRQSFTVVEGPSSGYLMPYSLPNGGTGTLVEAPTFVNPFNFTTQRPDQPAPLFNGNGIGMGNLSPVGSPVLSATDGLLYVLLRGPGNTTVVAAFDPERELTLRLKPYDLTKGVQIQQLNLLTFTQTPAAGDNNPSPWVSGNVGNGLIEGDGQAGTVTIKNMSAGQGRFSSSQSFFVTYTPNGATQPVTVVVSPTSRVQTFNNAGTDQVDPALPRQDFSPLLWYYVLPGTPTGGLSRVGGSLFYNSSFGIVSLDADPASSDADVRPAEAIRSIKHVRWVQKLGSGAASATSAASPVAGPDVIAVNTSQGTFAFENSTTLVADNGRIIEVGGDGEPLWSMDTTVDYKIVGGPLPIYDPANPALANLPGRQIFERRALSHPSVVRRLSGSEYLIADTGNNRLVRTNRGAQVSWEISKIIDPLRVLKSGDPLTLNNPTDVQLYQHQTLNGAGAVIGSEDHYLIADAGNYRLLEIVDYRDQNGAIRTIGGVRGEHVVVWATRTATDQGRRLRYKSAQRVYTTTSGGLYGFPTLVATIDNATASGAGGAVGADFTGGSLVRLDYNPANTFFLLRNAAGTPVTGAGAWPAVSGYPWVHVPGVADEPASNGAIRDVLDTVVFKAGSAGLASPTDFKYRITRPTYFQQLTVPGNMVPQIAYLVCDVNGAYQIEPRPDPSDPTKTEFVVTWFFDQSDYNRVNAQRILTQNPLGIFDPASLPAFRPVSAQRLPNGHILMTNAASGPTSLFEDGQFRGEVLEVTGGPRFGVGAALPTYGNFSAPAWAVTAPAAGLPRVRIRQRMGASSGTQPLEQPLFADRL